MAYRQLVDVVVAHTGLQGAQARRLLVLLGETVAREALLRGRRVWWPRLGVFAPFQAAPRKVSLAHLKASGHVPLEAPDSAEVPSLLRLRFRPSRDTAQLPTRKPSRRGT